MRQKATWVFFHTRTKTRRYRVFLGAVLGQHMAHRLVRPDGVIVQACAWTPKRTSINPRHYLIRPDLVCATLRNAVQRDGVDQKVSQVQKGDRSQR